MTINVEVTKDDVDNAKDDLNNNFLTPRGARILSDYMEALELDWQKVREENKLLKSDNKLLKKALKEKEKNYLNMSFFKDKRIKELEEKIYNLTYKQVSIDDE